MRRLFACFVATLLFGGGWLLLDGALASGNPSGDPGAGPTTTPPSDDPSEEPSDDPEGESDDDENSCDRTKAAASYLYRHGFAERNFIVGADVIDWSGNPLSHTAQAFSKPLHSEAALENFLDDDSSAAAAARSIIGDDLVVAGDEWVAVQFQVPVDYSGNWHWNGHKAIEGGNLRVAAGDIWWLNVSSECEVDASDSVRAACGNVGLDRLRPAFAKVD